MDSGRAVLREYFWIKRWRYLGGSFILLGTGILATLIPKVIGTITDALAKGQPTTEILRLVVWLIGLAVLVFGLKFIWRLMLMGGSRAVEVFLRDRLFAKLQVLPPAFYQDENTGDLIAHAISDVQAVRQMFGPGLLQALDGMVIGGLAVAAMATTIHPFLTLLCLAPVPLAALVVLRLRHPIRNRYRAAQETFAAVSARVQEDVTGVRVLKAFAREGATAEKFETLSEKRVQAQVAMVRVAALLSPGVQLCFGATFLVFIVWGSQLVSAHAITLGDFVAFNIYTLVIMGPVTNIAKIVDFMQRGIASFHRLDRLFRSPPAQGSFLPFETRPPIVTTTIKGDIEIRNLTFAYPGASRPALESLSLRIPAGSSLGLIGRTGSGKSTLINLLLRLFPVPDGTIFIDGRDLNTIDPGELREAVGCAPQDGFLFATTVRDNIAFFRPLEDQGRIAEALRLATVEETIAKLPRGLESIVGERGVTLSGGQKQRISLARTLVKNPAILMLDDSLSAVDAATEKQILSNIRSVLAGRTSLVVSHRIAAVQDLDQVVVLDEGRVVQAGPPSQLLASAGPYADLVRAQSEVRNQVFR